MKKLLILILLLLLTTCHKEEVSTWGWVYDYVMSYGNTESNVAIRISDCLKKYSEQYDLPIKVMTRLGGIESQYKQYAYNSRSTARGYGQIVDYHWRYALYHIDNGKLGKYLNKKNITNIGRIKRYYYRVGYAIEMMTFAANACRKIKKGDLREGLYLYGGGYSRGACQSHMSNYIKEIFND